MSTANSTPQLEQTPAVAAKPQRVLACVLCQQRKVKCDRKSPCANCVRGGAQCVPANTLSPRQRRRRLPERELLERLRHYEGLLRQNNITFDPLHPPTAGAEHASPSEDGRGSSNSLDVAHSEVSREKTTVKSKEAVDLWRAISRVMGKTLDTEDDDEEGEGDGDGNGDDDADTAFLNENYHVRHRGAVFKNAWTHRFQSEINDEAHDHLLFGPPGTNVDLSTSHPEQVQIFRLWQIYLDNVNPLLKVTHTPTLQPRIIDAASDVANISPVLEALIFSIYCVSVMSLADDECRTLFRSPRKNLLAGYQSACQQALLKCNVWRSGDADSLTGLYLYLVSVRPQTDPRPLSCMLAVAIRIAQRMGIHNKSSYTGCTALEAEIRRRLWWSLVSFDHRICELSEYKTTTLIPTWDCSIPLNVNEFEIRPDMKSPPAIHEKPTEALFAVVRSELADFVRHSAFHLNLVNPALNTIAQPKDAQQGPIPEGEELMTLEKIIEDKYLAFCDAEHPLHYMTIWTTRGYLARNRLLEHYSRYSTSSMRPTDTQRRAAFSYALGMLECDTKLRTSPLTQRYLWFVDSHFPALAYIHFLNGLGKQPAEEHPEKAWDAMNDNYEALITRPKQLEGNEYGGIYFLLVSFSRVVLQAWEAREALLKQQHKPPEPPPRLVSDIRFQMSLTSSPEHSNGEQPNNGAMGINNNDNFPMPTTPTELGGHPGTGGEQCFTGPGHAGYHPDIPGQAIMDVDMDHFWTDIDWRWLHTQGW